jgi:predicted transposase YbfD/YdcC
MPFALLIHDWSKLAFAFPKRDQVQLTHATDVGYELTTALLVSADDGSPLAPMEIHLKTAGGVLSTRRRAPKDVPHSDQVLPTMNAARTWDLPTASAHQITHVSRQQAPRWSRYTPIFDDDNCGKPLLLSNLMCAGRGHYLLAVKDNQPTLRAGLQQVFEDGLNTDFADVNHDTHTTVETAHGRITERTYHAIEIPHDHPQRKRWRDLRTLVLATSCVTQGEKETWETRMFISDLRPRAKSLGDAVRRHWSIENGQHWVLDVSFHEDTARQQDRHGSANLGAVRRLIVSLLRQEKTLKRGAKAKRMVCALDANYLLKVLATAEIDA